MKECAVNVSGWVSGDGEMSRGGEVGMVRYRCIV